MEAWWLSHLPIKESKQNQEMAQLPSAFWQRASRAPHVHKQSQWLDVNPSMAWVLVVFSYLPNSFSNSTELGRASCYYFFFKCSGEDYLLLDASRYYQSVEIIRAHIKDKSCGPWSFLQSFFDTEIGAQFCSISQFISVTKCCKCYIFCCACFSDMDISSLSQIIAS